MVIPAEVRSALVEHAEAESPNEACGLIALRDGVAERYVAGTNAASSALRLLDREDLLGYGIPEELHGQLIEGVRELFREADGEPEEDAVRTVLTRHLGEESGPTVFEQLRGAGRYRFNLFVDPAMWMALEDEGYELAIFHSHPESPPRPSRTDVERIGLWKGWPYLILSVRTGELAAWRIEDGRTEAEALSD